MYKFTDDFPTDFLMVAQSQDHNLLNRFLDKCHRDIDGYWHYGDGELTETETTMFVGNFGAALMERSNEN